MSVSAIVSITLSTPDGTERELNVPPDATIGQLKVLVQEQELREGRFQQRKCDIIFADNLLAEEEANLNDLGIADGACLTLVWREQLDRVAEVSYQSTSI